MSNAIVRKPTVFDKNPFSKKTLRRHAASLYRLATGTHLDIVFQDTVSKDAACTDRANKLKSGYWQAL